MSFAEKNEKIAGTVTDGYKKIESGVADGYKKIENGVMRIRQKDEKWGSLFMTALFLGMISAFLGMIFATVSEGLRGWIPCFVMIASALIMCVCAVFVKLLHWKWMEDYALPISMLGGMALSIPITNLVNMIAG